VLDAAIAALRRTTGLAARILPQRHAATADRTGARLEIKNDRRKHRFAAVVKNVDRFETPAQVKHQWADLDTNPILVAPYITQEIAQRCRGLRLPFMDTAGNAYIEVPGFLAWVVGQQRPIELKQRRFRALKPAGLQITFALLCRPDLLQTNYREIARAAKVALGTVGPVIKDLEARGLVRLAARGDQRILEPRRLLEEWTTHYHTTLRPKLNPRRFEAGTDFLEKADMAVCDAYWGGEVAADKLTHMLQPATFTIYAHEPIARLVAAQRLRADPRGRVEILDVFWDFAPDPGRPDVAPPVLAYADLLTTQDGRNLEAARLIHERFIEPALHRAA
jgi:hypothetical protein